MVSQQMRDLARRATAGDPIVNITMHREATVRALEAQVVPAGVEVRPAAGVEGSELVVPRGHAPRAAVVHLHSGGYVAGAPQLGREFAARVALDTGVAYYLPAYRLAPEHPFPAALDDGEAAYRRVLEEFPPERIAIGGASAGGGLALALLVRLRDTGTPLPAAAYLLSPWTDHRLRSATMTAEQCDDPLNSRTYLEEISRYYRGSASSADPLVSPVLADLSGLPPLHVEVGAPERLLDDSLAVVSAVAAAGGTVGLSVVEGALHTFPHGAFHTPEAAAAVARVGLHLRLHLEGL